MSHDEVGLSILAQLSEIRDRQLQQIGTLSALAANTETLIREVRGNGQPGLSQRVSSLEESRASYESFHTELVGGLQPGRLPKLETEQKKFWSELSALKQTATLASGAWFAVERIINWAFTIAALALAAKYKAGGN